MEGLVMTGATGNISSDMTSALTTGFSNIQADVLSVVTTGLPYALVVMGVGLAIGIGIKIFKKVTGR